MILVDTSVWVDHLRVGNARLRGLLLEEVVHCHPFVIGEVACGSLGSRSEVIGLMSGLPMAAVVDNEGVLRLIESRRLYGRGIGWIDAHLLAAAIASGVQLWTNDKRLRSIAEDLKVAAPRS